MRPPWFEAIPALAAAGFAAALTDGHLKPLPWRPRMDAAWRYALLRDPEDPADRPLVVDSLEALAGAIHRRRGGMAIQLADLAVDYAGRGETDGVSIWLYTDDGARGAFLGWAYLDGGGRETLQAALDRAMPNRRPTFGARRKVA